MRRCVRMSGCVRELQCRFGIYRKTSNSWERQSVATPIAEELEYRMPDLLSLLATLVFTLYVFTFGACFGSFLNVIVWRIPRGLPIAFARSHCPHCNTMIPGSDNIPIVGWLRLRGRCRFCRQQISMRYLVVETGVALLFAGLFLLIVVSQGATLPQHGQASQFTNWLTDFPNGWTLQVFLHQCVLGYALLAILLMDQERSETPWSFSLIMAALHLGLVCWNPAINQLDQLTQRPTLGSPLALASLSASLNYSLSGGVLALVLGGLARVLKLPCRVRNSLQALLLLGVFLGPIVLAWAALIAGTAQGMQWLAGKLRARPSGPVLGLALHLFCAWLIILCSWRWWPRAEWPPWG